MKKWLSLSVYLLLGIALPPLADMSFDADLDVTAWALVVLWVIWAVGFGILVTDGAKNAGNRRSDAHEQTGNATPNHERNRESPPRHLT